MAVIVNGDGILTGISSLATALTDLNTGRGTVTGVATVGTLQLGAGVSMSSPRSQQAAIFTNNTEFFTVDDAGRVGVGTITPNSDAHPENEKKINVGFITARSIAGDIDANTMVVAGVSTFVGALNAGAVSGTTGTFTGDVTVTGTTPSILLTDTDNNPDYLIKNGNGEFNIQDATASANRLSIDSSGNVVVGSDLIIPDKIVHASDTNTTIRFPAADTITAETGGNEVLRIDSSQRLLLGTSTSAGANRQFQIVGTTGTTAAMSICRNTNNNDGVTVDYVKSRNATYGSSTIVQDDDVIAKIQFRADDGADYVSQAASITAAIDGTPGSNDMPGRLVFSTTADGSASPSERLRITSAGKVGINESSPDSMLHISGDSATAQIRLQRSNSASNTNDYGRIYFESNSNYLNGEISVARESGEDNGYMHFKTASGGTLTERLRITSDGDVKINSGDIYFATAGKGIVLGATSNTSANTLSDYETGTYTITATLGSGSVSSYTSNTGSYIKIGSVVHVVGRLHLNVSTSNVTSFSINLPFANESGTERDTSCICHVIRANGGDPVQGVRLFRIVPDASSASMQDHEGQATGNLGATNPHININFTYHCVL